LEKFLQRFPSPKKGQFKDFEDIMKISQHCRILEKFLQRFPSPKKGQFKENDENERGRWVWGVQ
jgi:hypothetical protein